MYKMYSYILDYIVETQAIYLTLYIIIIKSLIFSLNNEIKKYMMLILRLTLLRL